MWIGVDLDEEDEDDDKCGQWLLPGRARWGGIQGGLRVQVFWTLLRFAWLLVRTVPWTDPQTDPQTDPRTDPRRTSLTLFFAPFRRSGHVPRNIDWIVCSLCFGIRILSPSPALKYYPFKIKLLLGHLKCCWNIVFFAAKTLHRQPDSNHLSQFTLYKSI